MRKKRIAKRTLTLAVAFCMLFQLCAALIPATGNVVQAAVVSGTYHDYQYVVAGSSATITQYTLANVSTPEVLFVPSEITYPEAKNGEVKYNTATVTTLGNGSSSAFTNSKNTTYVFLPEGVTTISNYAIYDYNVVVGWSFPSTIATITENAFESSFTSTDTLYVPSDVEAVSSIGSSNNIKVSTDVKTLTVSQAADLENGTLYPSGTYYIPSNIDAGYTATFYAYANAGYKVDSVSVDGKTVEVGDDGSFEVKLSDLGNNVTITATFAEDASFDMEAYVTELAEQTEEKDVDDPNSIIYITDKDVTAEDGGIYDFSNSTGGKLIVTGDVSIKLRNLSIGSKSTAVVGMPPPGVAMTATEDEEEETDDTPRIYDSLNDLFTVQGGPYTIIFDTYNTHIYENAIDGEGKGTAENGTFKLSDGSIFTGLEDMDSDSRYNVTIGPSGGVYFARSIMFYEMTGNLNTAAILAGESLDGDYVYNYAGTYSSEGPFYGYYAYKASSLENGVLDLGGELITIGSNPDSEIGDEDCVTNTSAILARFGAVLTVNGLNAYSYSRYDGPTEGSNFWGTNSVILADSYAHITVNDAVVGGQANSVYATEYSTIDLNGGDYTANYSGSHGFYVGYGGTINVNIDKESDDSNRDILTYVTTYDEASTTLATDTGGGIIEVSNVEATAYGLRSGGVYSIGNSDGDVRVYNSVITSYLDGGFVSASGGLITGDNCIVQGVYALKARSGGGADASINVSNSLLVSAVDMDALEAAGYKTDCHEYEDIDWENETESEDFNGFNLTNGGLNFFLDKMNKEVKYASQYFWYGDGNGGSATYTSVAADGTESTVTYMPYANAPGHSGGGILGVIYFTESASYPMNVTACRLYNDNYEQHKDDSADLRNYLIVSDGGSTANVIFNDENSNTKWDKTGEYSETTELVGDLYAGLNEASAVMAPGGVVGSYSFVSSKIAMVMNNSEWTGTTVGNTDGISLTMDGSSVWYVTEDTKIGTLTLEDGAKVTAADGYEIAEISYATAPTASGDASGDSAQKAEVVTVSADELGAGTYYNVVITSVAGTSAAEVQTDASGNAEVSSDGSSVNPVLIGGIVVVAAAAIGGGAYAASKKKKDN